MSIEFNILEILDTVFKEITKKVTKIDMYNTNITNFNKNTKSLIINTSGNYKFTLILCSEIDVLKAIAESMKREKVKDVDELAIYVKEYFNIFCGRAITNINNITKKPMRFSVPNFVDGLYLDNISQEGLNVKELYYKSDYGVAKIQIVDQVIDK